MGASGIGAVDLSREEVGKDARNSRSSLDPANPKLSDPIPGEDAGSAAKLPGLEALKLIKIKVCPSLDHQRYATYHMQYDVY